MRFALLTLALAIVGCGAPTSTTDVEIRRPGYRVQVHNAGSVTLRNIRVTTGQNVPPITIPELTPGTRSGTAIVAALHEYPIVTLTADGRNLAVQPVEGFSGFNGQVAPGSYVIGLDYQPASHQLIVRVAVAQ